ncbi:MAG: hypothetical protein AB7N76_08865 [Planctomycetota bacterium]
MFLLIELSLLFAAGLVLDALNTAHIRAVTDRARASAALLSGLANLLWLLVFARLVGQLEPGAALGKVLAYALGNSTGTWIGMRRGATP